MSTLLRAIIRQFLFWILFFAITRFVFIAYNYSEILDNHVSFLEQLACFWHALRLDVATSCYFLILPFFIFLFQSVYFVNWLNKVIKIYTYLLVVVYSFVTATELGIYPEWKTKLHYKALMYLSHPSEIANSADSKVFFLLLFIGILQIAIGIFLYNRYFFKDFVNKPFLIWADFDTIRNNRFWINIGNFLRLNIVPGHAPQAVTRFVVEQQPGCVTQTQF